MKETRVKMSHRKFDSLIRKLNPRAKIECVEDLEWDYDKKKMVPFFLYYNENGDHVGSWQSSFGWFFESVLFAEKN